MMSCHQGSNGGLKSVVLQKCFIPLQHLLECAISSRLHSCYLSTAASAEASEVLPNRQHPQAYGICGQQPRTPKHLSVMSTQLSGMLRKTSGFSLGLWGTQGLLRPAQAFLLRHPWQPSLLCPPVSGYLGKPGDGHLPACK